MHVKSIGDTLVIRLERGEELVNSLMAICAQQGVPLGVVSGLGAVDQATVGLYRVAEKQYHATELTGEREMVSLTGNVTTQAGKVYLHLHAAFADDTAAVTGGHLNAARISATAEIFIRRLPGAVERFKDEKIGLNFMDV